MTEFLGTVRQGEFVVFSQTLPGQRLTRIQVQEAMAPEAQEIHLDSLEDKVITVDGIGQGGWIYSANITSVQYFRANVGIVLVNHEGLVLALERKKEDVNEGTNQWQMAQGGLGELEEPKEGALREIREELGLSSEKIELIAEHPEWLVYELPPEARKAKHGRGQVQKWFLYRFLGEESDINLKGIGAEREFHQFKWMPLDDLAKITWAIRRPIYEKLTSHFKEYLAT